jgi:hypothetical protein
LKSIVPPQLIGGGLVFRNKPVAGFAVRAYFHNREIMDTSPGNAQAAFSYT